MKNLSKSDFFFMGFTYVICNFFVYIFRPRSMPSLEVKGMSFSQSVEAPLTLKDTAFMSGNVNCNLLIYRVIFTNSRTIYPTGQLSTHKGSGSGSVNVSLRRLTSAEGYAEVDMGFGSGLSFSAKGFRNLTKRIFTNVSGIVTFTDRGIVLGFASSIYAHSRL